MHANGIDPEYLYCSVKKKIFIAMQSVGFEPTHPKILRPERSALDHSAKIAVELVI